MATLKYWMVHCTNRGAPTKRHESKLAAQQEATRLAEQHPGNEFFVLEAVNCYATEKPKVVSLDVTAHG